MPINDVKDLFCIEIELNKPTKKTIIWMHGLGADANDFVPLIPELKLPANLPYKFIFPNADERPVTINNGYVMRAWYDILEMSIDRRIDIVGMNASRKQIHTLIAREMENGIRSEDIILAGFSQGAVMALFTGLTYPKPLGGIMALSGYLTPETLKEANPANQSIPLFMAHGTQDGVVPFVLGKAAADQLYAAGYSIEWHSYAMQHTVCGEEVAAISQWLQKALGNKQ